VTTQKYGTEPSNEPQEAPELPPTEPDPAPVQDPPAEPNPAPYVVRGLHGAARAHSVTTETAKDRIMNNGERKERRGFASMSPEKQREIASKGGRAAHQKGTAHEWTSDEARNAGRKGGQISRGGRGRLVEPTTSPAAPSSGTGESAQGGE
jgi:general stress protein YciG